MIRDALRTWWEEPRAPGAPQRVWRDWVVTGALVVTALLEGVVRPDVPWRVPSTALAVALAVALLWRRTHPLGVVLFSFGTAIMLTAAAMVADVGPVGLDTSVLVLLLPYALFRWAAGREMFLGLVVMLVAAVLGIASDWNGIGAAAAGMLALLFPAALGASVRYRDHARRREIEQVTLHERGRLARELHDVVAHHVSAIAVRAQAGQLLAGTDPDAALEALRVVETEASRALEEMRAMVGVLREGLPAELAPQSGVADLLRLQREEPAPRILVEVDEGAHDVPPTVASALYRVAQESVTNAVRHARGATRVEICVRREGDAVRVTVRDDGVPTGPGRVTSGYGLLGMSERVAVLGGEFSAGPQPGRGWLVDAVVPTARRRG